jgi:hypothetical protein
MCLAYIARELSKPHSYNEDPRVSLPTPHLMGPSHCTLGLQTQIGLC